MYLLRRVHLVQFFLFDAQTLELDATTAIIAPNGAGKSALLDALQIVMLGGDRSRIRFNAQAGGTHRARTMRDYCLGVFRTGEEGRKRRTATTYISLVFENDDSGDCLTAGIALGASADEPDHRQHGLYLLPRVALNLEDHLERIEGDELPLEWPAFRALIVGRCKNVGTKADLHQTSDRFVKDLLVRLRPGPTSFLDPLAYRKAFQNALDLQRVSDVDLFVRTLVAEDRPTDIARFRELLGGFRMLKEKIEQVEQRIVAAELVDAEYRKVATQATRAASYRALEAECERDLHSERLDAAEDKLLTAKSAVAERQRALLQARSDRDTARGEYEGASQRLQGTRGYNEQSSFDEIAGRDRVDMVEQKRTLMRLVSGVRDALQRASSLHLPGLDETLLAGTIAPWVALYEQISALPADAPIGLAPEAVHTSLQQAALQSTPVRTAVAAYAREQHNALDRVRERFAAARGNYARLGAGKAELRPDVIRLMSYLADEGINVRPVCDLVKVVDVAWQPVIEAYLRTHVEALLVPVNHEEHAVRIYRALQGGRSVYGVKLALASQARHFHGTGAAELGRVSALLVGDNDAAVAYLRRQIGELRCVDTESELVGHAQGLSRDGVVAKGGGIERLRLPAASDLKIGATDNRDRQILLRQEMESADREVRELEARCKNVDAAHAGLERIGDTDELAQDAHGMVLKHREAEGRYRALQDRQAAIADPDLLRLSEQVRALAEQGLVLQDKVEKLSGEQAIAEREVNESIAALATLSAQQGAIAQRAVAAFADPDVDANLVEFQRRELESRHPLQSDQLERCRVRAADSDRQLTSLLPEAWRGLAQYARDHGLELEIEPRDWRLAIKLLRKEIDDLQGTELVQYKAEAEHAYTTAVSTFRSNVASALHDNFSRLREQLNLLNRTLKHSPAFSNNERYQFHCEVVSDLRALHRFIGTAADVGDADNLFGSAGEVPDAFRDIIEEAVSARGAVAPSPLDDYRRFFHFEVQIRQDDLVVGTLSERMRSGSGGEHRAPLYVIAGAALAAAYDKKESQQGGLGVIMLDEFGDKIDAQNARAITNYLRSLGLQLILAAPDTAQGTLTGVLDSYVELFRDGDLIQLERVQVTDAGRALLESDQFVLHPHLLADETARIASEQSST